MDINNDLNKNYLLQVTNELYRLTLLFPKKEPLRYKMRELADEVLSDFIFLSQKNFDQSKATAVRNSIKKIEVIDGLFEVARSQNWVKPAEILSLQKEYSKIREKFIKIQEEEKEDKKEEIPQKPEKKEEPAKAAEIKKEKPEKKEEVKKPEKKEKESPPEGGKEPTVSERQKDILKVLKEKGHVQVWEIKDIFSGVSKRTLRRDFKSLLNQGLVERMGERNNTFYKIK